MAFNINISNEPKDEAQFQLNAMTTKSSLFASPFQFLNLSISSTFSPNLSFANSTDAVGTIPSTESVKEELNLFGITTFMYIGFEFILMVVICLGNGLVIVAVARFSVSIFQIFNIQ